MQTVCRSQTDLNREILINISSQDWFYSAKQNWSTAEYLRDFFNLHYLIVFFSPTG